MKKIKEAIRQLLKRRQEYCDAKYMQQLQSEASRRIQIREYEESIYVCVDGIPLLRESDIAADFCDTVGNMRDHWIYYKATEHRRLC